MGGGINAQVTAVASHILTPTPTCTPTPTPTPHPHPYIHTYVCTYVLHVRMHTRQTQKHTLCAIISTISGRYSCSRTRQRCFSGPVLYSFKDSMNSCHSSTVVHATVHPGSGSGTSSCTALVFLQPAPAEAGKARGRYHQVHWCK